MSSRLSAPASPRFAIGAYALAAVATVATIAIDSGDAHGAGLRALVNRSASNIGDPWPSVVAADRLAHAWHAPLFTDFTDAGSSFIYPPLAALPYTFAAGVGYEGAHARLAILSRVAWVACIGVAIVLAWSRCKSVAPVVGFGLAAALLFYPLLRAVELNQATLLVAVLLGASLLLAQRGYDGAAGAVCAASAMFKPQLALVAPLLYFSSRRFALSAAASLVGLGAASVVYAGVANHVRYVSSVLPRLSGGYAFYPNQSFSGTLLRLSGAYPYDFDLHQPPAWMRVVGAAFTVAVLTGGLWLQRRAAARSSTRDGLVLALLASWLTVTLASPISWEHHYAPALFAFAVLFGRAVSGDSTRAAVVGGAAAFPLVAGYLDVRFWSGSFLGRLAMSYLLLGALVLTATIVYELLWAPVGRASAHE